MIRQAFNKTARHLPFLAGLLTAHLLIYHEYWGLHKLFTGSDFFQLFAPVANFQADCLREGSWPLWNPYINFGFPWVGNYVNSALFPSHLILSLLTRFGVQVLQLEILAWIMAGGVGVYLCAVELGRSGRTAFLAAVSFMFCGQMIALPQWGGMIYNAATFPFLLYGYERAKRSGRTFSALAALFLALGVLGGYIPASVIGLYFYAGYILVDSLLSKRARFGIVFLFITVTIGVFLALPKLVPLYLSMQASPRLTAVSSDPRFGIVSLYNFLTYLLPVKFYFSLYIGMLPLLALIRSSIRKTVKADAFLIMFIVSACLLLTDENGAPSFVREGANAVFPFIGLIRLEFIYWYYPSLFALLFASRAIDEFFGEADLKNTAAALGLSVVILTVLFWGAYDTGLFMGAFLAHLVLAVLWAASTRLPQKGGMREIAVCTLVVLEFWAVFARVGIDNPPVKIGSHMNIVLNDQNYISPSFRNNERVRNLMPLRITQDHLRPTISESKQWPVLLPVTPGSPLPNYAEVLNQKRFTGWWYNPQESFAFGSLKETEYFRMLDNAPLFIYYDRTTGQPVDNAGTFDDITCSSFSFSVRSAVPGFLLLHQMYDHRWKLFLDGVEQHVIRANTFFMGTELEAGTHTVRFVFEDPVFTLSAAVSLLTLALLAGILINRGIRSRQTARQQKNRCAE